MKQQSKLWFMFLSFNMLSNTAQKVEFTMNNQNNCEQWIQKFKAENLFW